VTSTVERSALVPYGPEEMFDLVADVEAYPRFLPWCREAQVHHRSDAEMRASVRMARGPLRIGFTTRNRLDPGRRIDMELVDGPFRTLTGTWRFEPVGDSGCKVSLRMVYELSNRIARRALSRFFEDAADSMVDAFCARAREMHEDA